MRLSWGKTGFAKVTDDVLKRREDACMVCPNLSSPSSLLHKIITSKKGNYFDRKICNQCGCNAGKKMRLVSESCPEEDNQTGLTRWGERKLK